MGKLVLDNEVLENVKSGMTVMVGGFLGVGIPETILNKLAESGTSDLTIISNDTGFPGKGIAKLIEQKQACRVIATHIGTNPETGRQLTSGETDVQLVPQGTLAERIRAAGTGLGGVLTPTGIGTIVEEGKEKIEIYGKEYLLELPLKADVALIKAYKADAKGNLVFRRSSRNFNPIMAMAADYVVAEVENYVNDDTIDPDDVMLPGIFVDAIVKGGK